MKQSHQQGLTCPGFEQDREPCTSTGCCGQQVVLVMVGSVWMALDSHALLHPLLPTVPCTHQPGHLCLWESSATYPGSQTGRGWPCGHAFMGTQRYTSPTTTSLSPAGWPHGGCAASATSVPHPPHTNVPTALGSPQSHLRVTWGCARITLKSQSLP